MRITLILPLLVAASPALADTLPLARGVYVAAEESCVSPANAFAQTYDGRGFGSSKAAQCRSLGVTRVGKRYTLRQSCLQYGDPSGRTPRAIEVVRVRIDSPTRYTDLVHQSRFRLCPGLKL